MSTARKPDRLVIVKAKGSERYVFVFHDDTADDLLRTLGKFAANPDLSFNWSDATDLAREVRKGTRRSD